MASWVLAETRNLRVAETPEQQRRNHPQEYTMAKNAIATKTAAPLAAKSAPKVTIKTQADPAKKSNVMTASRQWASRPADERFWTIKDMFEATKRVDTARKAIAVKPQDIEAVLTDGGLRLAMPGIEKPAALTHWGFQQLAAKIGAPARYLRSLPEKNVVELLNIGLHSSETYFEDLSAEVRVGVRNDYYDPHIESWTSTRYGYIPNWRVCDGLSHLENLGWRVPPARPAVNDVRARKATAEDVLQNNKLSGGLGVKVGDLIAPAGLYASDKDMFAFLVNPGNPLAAGKFNLNRGIFVENSEVGSGAFRITTFLYDGVCGNHIVWGASDLTEITVRHVGKADPRAWVALTEQLKGYLEADASLCVKRITAAGKFSLGTDKDTVVDNLFSNRKIKLTREVLSNAFDRAVELDGDRVDVTSAWGMVTGLTRVSQEEANADRRTEIDSATTVVMAMVN